VTCRTLLLLATFLLPACAPSSTAHSQNLDEVVGSWVGGEVLEHERPDSQVLVLAVRPDSSLYIAMIYEAGPRARLWTYDLDVVAVFAAGNYGVDVARTYHEIMSEHVLPAVITGPVEGGGQP